VKWNAPFLIMIRQVKGILTRPWATFKCHRLFSSTALLPSAKVSQALWLVIFSR
jgi:hypothetical protein